MNVLFGECLCDVCKLAGAVRFGMSRHGTIYAASLALRMHSSKRTAVAPVIVSTVDVCIVWMFCGAMLAITSTVDCSACMISHKFSISSPDPGINDELRAWPGQTNRGLGYAISSIQGRMASSLQRKCPTTCCSISLKAAQGLQRESSHVSIVPTKF